MKVQCFASLVMVVIASLASSAHASSGIILERADRQGAADLLDIKVYANGEVYRWPTEGPMELVATLSFDQVVQLEDLLFALPPPGTSFVQTDPSQMHSPSGFITEYYAYPPGNIVGGWLFADFESGVSYSMPGSQAASLKQTLDSFAK